MKGGVPMKKKAKIFLASFIVLFCAVCTYLHFSAASAFTFSYSKNETGITIDEYHGFRWNVKIPKQIEGLPVTEIGEKAFYNNSWLRSVTIPDSVEKIGKGAFMNTSLKSFTFPDRIETIADYVLFGCSNLENVVISGQVLRVGNDAFGYCTKLTSIELPDSITDIGNNAFANDTKLQEINIPVKLQRVGYRIFAFTKYEENLPHNEYTLIGNNILYIYRGSSDVIEVPANIQSIAGGAFCACPAAEINIEKVSYIGRAAFADCKNLVAIKMPDNAEIDGSKLFSECSSLKEVILPYDCNIGNSMFYGCKDLRSVTLQGTPTTVGANAFSDCSSLSTLILPESIDTILEGAFARSGLCSITIPENVKVIAAECFADCSSLDWAALSPYTELIEKRAFANCSSLSQINIPDGIKSIGEQAFRATNINSVELPDSLDFLGDYAFANCESLKDIKLPLSLKAVPYGCFCECSALMEIVIPNGYTEIGSNSFTECEELCRVVLPEGLQKIDFNAFYGCNISAVYLPDSLVEFDDQSFIRKHGYGPVTICYTAHCGAAQQIKDAYQKWIVHTYYVLKLVEDRNEAEELQFLRPVISKAEENVQEETESDSLSKTDREIFEQIQKKYENFSSKSVTYNQDTKQKFNTNVVGEVVDAESGEKIVNAVICIDDFSVQTDEEGKFQVRNMPNGYYTFTVSKDGYYEGVYKNYPISEHNGTDIYKFFISKSQSIEDEYAPFIEEATNG